MATIDNGTSCGFSAANSSYPGTDPGLGALADNGGPTQTMRLLPGSPALDKYGCVGSGGYDQRGIQRPQGPKFDIGAFELEDKIFANGCE